MLEWYVVALQVVGPLLCSFKLLILITHKLLVLNSIFMYWKSEKYSVLKDEIKTIYAVLVTKCYVKMLMYKNINNWYNYYTFRIVSANDKRISIGIFIKNKIWDLWHKTDITYITYVYI